MSYIFKLFFAFFILPFATSATELQQAIDHTIENNLKIKAARYKFLAEKEQYNQMFSAFLPSVNLSLSHDIQEDTFSPLRKSISINQQIFSFGGDIAAYRKTKKLVSAAKISFLQIKQQVILDIIKAYTTVIEKEETSKLYEHSVLTIKKHLEAVKQRFELGESTKTDLEKSKSRLSVTISEKIRADGELSNSYANYIHIAGIKPEQLYEPKTLPTIPLSLQQAINLAFLNNLQMKLSALTHKSAKNAVEEANAKFFPSVSLSLNLSEDEVKNTQSIMLTTSIPLFQGGVNYFKMKQVKYSFEQSRENFYETERVVEELITIAWNNLITAKSVLESSKQEVESMSIVLESEREERKLNLSTILDVIDAENDLLKTKKQHLAAKMQYIIAVYNLALLTNNLEELFK